MSHKDASNAVTFVRTVALQAEANAKCLMQFVHLAASVAKFHSNPEKTAQFTVAIAFQARDN